MTEEISEAPFFDPLYFARGGEVRYYSLARHALLEGLRLAGIGPGSKVLLPSYVCRDLLAPIAILDATPLWYDVSDTLQPLYDPATWPLADAVLAVDYFGFPQNLTPFLAYTARTGALLIEDNAHGYLSRAEDGRWLATRGDIGLFSLRKTLRVPDGAALLVNASKLAQRVPPQLPFSGIGLNPAQAFKAKLRRTPLIGETLLRLSTAMARAIRQLHSGAAIPPPDPASERELPAVPEPWSGLLHALRQCDAIAEIERRRESYRRCSATGRQAGVEPVFAQLPAGCAPYAYAFRGSPHAVETMRRFATREGYDFVTWPDLPDAIATTAPDYYRNVFLINFLW